MYSMLNILLNPILTLKYKQTQKRVFLKTERNSENLEEISQKIGNPDAYIYITSCRFLN